MNVQDGPKFERHFETRQTKRTTFFGHTVSMNSRSNEASIQFNRYCRLFTVDGEPTL